MHLLLNCTELIEKLTVFYVDLELYRTYSLSFYFALIFYLTVKRDIHIKTQDMIVNDQLLDQLIIFTLVMMFAVLDVPLSTASLLCINCRFVHVC